MLACLFLLWTQTTVWKTDPHEIILHRSAGMVAPENSIPALEAAFRQGADGVEIDIRRTLDGEFVLYHDDWVFMQHGPGRLIEDMTLDEVRALDIGVRWGQRWKGLRAPLLRDVLRFARENRMLLFLDIKTRDIDEPLRRMLLSEAVEDLVIVPERMRSSARSIPWISGWNYLDGGEESLSTMARVATLLGREPRRAMVDDARALVMALGRRPALRSMSPYRDSWSTITAPRLGAAAKRKWEARRAVSTGSEASLRKLAQDERADPKLRLEAIWALGAYPSEATRELLRRLFLQPDAPDPKAHPSRMPYFDTYRRAGTAASLARLGDWDQLRQLAERDLSFGRTAIGLSWAAFGGPFSQMSVALPTPQQPGIGLAMGHALAHPRAFEYCLKVAATSTVGYDRRMAVFGLASLDEPASERLAQIVASGTEAERLAAAQALYWRDSKEAASARARVLKDPISEGIRAILSAPRP